MALQHVIQLSGDHYGVWQDVLHLVCYAMLDSYQGLDKQHQQGEEKVYLNVGRLYNVAALKTTNKSLALISYLYA